MTVDQLTITALAEAWDAEPDTATRPTRCGACGSHDLVRMAERLWICRSCRGTFSEGD